MPITYAAFDPRNRRNLSPDGVPLADLKADLAKKETAQISLDKGLVDINERVASNDPSIYRGISSDRASYGENVQAENVRLNQAEINRANAQIKKMEGFREVTGSVEEPEKPKIHQNEIINVGRSPAAMRWEQTQANRTRQRPKPAEDFRSGLQISREKPTREQALADYQASYQGSNSLAEAETRKFLYDNADRQKDITVAEANAGRPTGSDPIEPEAITGRFSRGSTGNEMNTIHKASFHTNVVAPDAITDGLGFTRGSLEMEGGQLKLKGVEFETDPYKRAEKKLGKQTKTALTRINDKYSVIQQLKGETDINGNLAPQTRQRIATLERKQKDEIQRVKDSAEEGREELIISERANQQKILDNLNERKSFSELKEQTKIDRVNELLAGGLSMREALFKVEREETVLRKDPRAMEIAGAVDSIMNTELDDFSKFEQIYTTAGNNLDSATTAFESRFGKAVANDLKQQFLRSNGYDESTIAEENYATFTADIYNGSHQGAPAIAAFVKKSKAMGMDDQTMARQLGAFTISPNTDENTKRAAEAQLEQLDYDGGRREASDDLSYLASAVDRGDISLKDLNKQDRGDLLKSGYVPKDEAQITPEIKKEIDLARIRGGRLTNTQLESVEDDAISGGWGEEFKQALEEGKPVGERIATKFGVSTNITRGELDAIIEIREQKGLGNKKFQAFPEKEKAELQKFLAFKDEIEKIESVYKKFTDAGGGLDNVWQGGSRVASKIGRWAIPGVGTSDELQLYEDLESLTGKALAEFVKEMSGAAVSDQEFSRLSKIKANVDMSDEAFVKQLGRMREEWSASARAKGQRYGFDSLEQMESAIKGGADTDISQQEIDAHLGRGGASLSPEIGSVSERFESKGDSGAYGFDKVGGASYGSYQMTKGTASSFAKQMGIEGAIGTDEFLKNWRAKVKEDPEGFKNAEKTVIKKSHFEPQLKKIYTETKINPRTFSPKIMQAIWSTSVQHGANTDVITNILKSAPKDITEDQLLELIYKERGDRFPSSTAPVRAAVRNRFFGKGGELETLKNL